MGTYFGELQQIIELKQEIEQLTLVAEAAVGLQRERDELKRRNEIVGPWLSAALENPNVCDEMKQDIQAWFGEKK